MEDDIGVITIKNILGNLFIRSSCSLFVFTACLCCSSRHKNATIIAAGLTVLFGIVAAFLLLPSIHKFKVGTLELERAPQVSSDQNVVLTSSDPVLDTIMSPRIDDRAMLLVYRTPSVVIPVKDDVARLFIEIEYQRRMPKKILHMI
jgi:hypothetical protein